MPEALGYNTEFLNRSPNKSPRTSNTRYAVVVWHETAGNPEDPESTLRYNLNPTVGSSYHFLISKDGTIYAYVEPHEWTAWHTGVSRYTVDGSTYGHFACNEHAIGVELDGRNLGAPITAYQLASAGRLARSFQVDYGIPLDRAHHLTHAEIALPSGRKTDPKGYTPDEVLASAQGVPPFPITTIVYLTTTTAANVRTKPGRDGAIVLVMPAGTTAGYDGDTIGESIGGNNVWRHRADKLGFTHSSLLVPA